MQLAIETIGLSKSYGTVCAVDSIHLSVMPGEIYGFIGLNGAGKTTTIRALLGMIHPSAGSVKLFGETVGPYGRGPWHRVGHMVEIPTAYPELTVWENLEIARRMQRLTEKHATQRTIDTLGLTTWANRKAGTLSTGNLQRLGLARALLHQPELLVLDEPANGLDPAGVVEIRDLLSRLSHENGVTVFMSSHILTEVDRLATRIGIIHQGHLLEELESHALEDLRARRLVIRARDMDAARSALVLAGFAVKIRESEIYLTDERAIDAPDTVAAVLAQASVPPTHLAIEQENLEDYFLRLTGEKR